MYLAQLSTLQTQAPFYISILENIVQGNAERESIESIDSAISEAIQVAKGDKNIFSIDLYRRVIFAIIFRGKSWRSDNFR